MAGHKETPRQKMIGMMYLVLLALLAMNVSREVLNAFVVLNSAIEKNNETIEGKNQETLAEFEKQYSINQKKVGPYLEKARVIMASSKELDTYLENLKRHLIAATEGKESVDQVEHDSLFQLANVGAKDNYDIPTTILIGSNEADPKDGPWTAKEVRQKLEEFEQILVSQLNDEDREDFTAGFNFGDIKNAEGKAEKWEIGTFYHVPLAAIVTNLTRYQAEVKSAQAEALGLLFGEISAEDFKFDTLAVRVLANSNYVVLGDSFKADVIVAAYSTTQDPKLMVGTDIDTSGSESDWQVVSPVDTARVKVKNGVATYGYRPTSEGEVNWGGFIVIKTPSGEDKKYPFKHSFIAAKPALVVSPTAMNVFYRGLQNPLEVSVSGFSTSQLSVSASGATLSGSNGSYQVSPGREGREVSISVSVRMKDGSSRSMGETKFRVKNVPLPTPKFAGVKGTGKVTTAQLKAADRVFVELEDFLFDGVRYEVVGFDMLGFNRGDPVPLSSKNDRLTSAMKNLIEVQRRGSRMFIENIFVVGPDGLKRKIPGGVNLEII